MPLTVSLGQKTLSQIFYYTHTWDSKVSKQHQRQHRWWMTEITINILRNSWDNDILEDTTKLKISVLRVHNGFQHSLCRNFVFLGVSSSGFCQSGVKVGCIAHFCGFVHLKCSLWFVVHQIGCNITCLVAYLQRQDILTLRGLNNANYVIMLISNIQMIINNVLLSQATHKTICSSCVV